MYLTLNITYIHFIVEHIRLMVFDANSYSKRVKVKSPGSAFSSLLVLQYKEFVKEFLETAQLQKNLKKS